MIAPAEKTAAFRALHKKGRPLSFPTHGTLGRRVFWKVLASKRLPRPARASPSLLGAMTMRLRARKASTMPAQSLALLIFRSRRTWKTVSA